MLNLEMAVQLWFQSTLGEIAEASEVGISVTLKGQEHQGLTQGAEFPGLMQSFPQMFIGKEILRASPNISGQTNPIKTMMKNCWKKALVFTSNGFLTCFWFLLRPTKVDAIRVYQVQHNKQNVFFFVNASQ